MPEDTTDEDTRSRILIVEDDDIQGRVLASGLEAMGFATDVIANGLDAVWKAEANIYDVVLVDFQIPQIDGLATARLIRALTGPIARPMLIALTASPEALSAKATQTEKAFDFILGKSGDLAPLVAVIRSSLTALPDILTRRAAVSESLERAWSDYDSTPARPGANGDDPGPVRILVIEDDDVQRDSENRLREPGGEDDGTESSKDEKAATKRMSRSVSEAAKERKAEDRRGLHRWSKLKIHF